jgi:hypothetical protein
MVFPEIVYANAAGWKHSAEEFLPISLKTLVPKICGKFKID